MVHSVRYYDIAGENPQNMAGSQVIAAGLNTIAAKKEQNSPVPSVQRLARWDRLRTAVLIKTLFPGVAVRLGVRGPATDWNSG